MKIDVKQLDSACALVGKITGTNLLNFRAAKGLLAVSGETNGRSLTTYMPIEEDLQFELAVDKAVLDKTIKGRKELDMQVDGGTLRFSAKTYRVELQSQAYTDSPQLDKTGGLEIDEDQQAILDHALPYVLLNPVLEQGVMFFAEFDKKSSRVACMDTLHFALYTTKGTKRPLSLAFPTHTFQTITDTARKQKYELAATASAICAWNKEFELLLPFVQQDAAEGIDDLSTLASTFTTKGAIVDVASLCKAIESASSTCEDGSPITIVCKKEMVQISSQSTVGSVAERIAADVRKPSEGKVSPKTALDMLANILTDECEIGIHDDRFFFARTVDDDADIIYGCLLSQVD